MGGVLADRRLALSVVRSTTMACAAIGVVCGWWSAPLAAARRRLRSWGAVGGAVAAIWLESVWFGGYAAGTALLIGFAVGLAAHMGFRAVLIERFAHQGG